MENNESKKNTKVVSNFLSKASDFGKKAGDLGKKAADSTKKGVKTLQDKAQSDGYARRMKKYNPLFPEQYNSDSFNIPNMIMIVDDAVRRGIDVCEGAIGWLGNANGMEVFYLYDEWIEESGIEFVPTATCDAIYYVDAFDRGRFIRVDCIFGKAHSEKVAELEHVAYSLGAKSCSIEIIEADSELIKYKDKSSQGEKGSYKGVPASTNASMDVGMQTKKVSQRKGKTVSYFEGNNQPVQPILKWFSHDDNVKRLIDMRCNNANSIKSKVLELEGSTSATMSQKTAFAIDGAIGKMGTKFATDMEKQAAREIHSKLIFEIEF